MLVSMNKKAALGEPPTFLTFAAIILLFCTVVIFSIVFSIHSAQIKEKIDAKIVTQESGYLLLNLLRTPIEIAGVDSDVSQLISLWYLNPGKYKDKLTTEISKIINDFYDADMDWELTAEGENEEWIQTKNLFERIQSKLTTTATNEAETDIPLHYNSDEKIVSITIKIYLNTVKENTGCYNLNADACDVDLKKLCHCDMVGYRPLWTRCEKCPDGQSCNPIKEKCEKIKSEK